MRVLLKIFLWLLFTLLMVSLTDQGSVPSAFAQATPCADLIVTDITFSPTQPLKGQNSVVNVTVKNQGSCSTLGFVVQWKPGLLAAPLSAQTSGLGPGASRLVSFNYIFPNAGNLTTVAIADSSRNVNETNEFNNNILKPVTVLKSGIDLVITSFTLNPAKPVQGRVAQATITMQNLGNTPAGEFVVQWKPTLLAADLATQVNGLGPGASTSVSFNYTYLFFGDFTTVATVDSTSRVLETDELNNRESMPLTVEPPRPDLVITSLTISPSQPVEGIQATVTVVVKNQGNTRAEEFLVQWKPNPLASDQARQINGLNVGQSIAVNFNHTYPFPGEFMSVAEVDSTHRVLELDETNNRATLLVTVQQATVDLLITNLTISPPQPTQGAPATVFVTVRNQGNSPAGPFVVQWNPDFLGLITPGPATLSKQVNGLGVGASRVVNFTFTYPKQGNFLTVATVDAFNNIKETDETNNRETLNVLVQPGIDLVITNFFINPASPTRLSKATANITVRNQGVFPAGTFWVQWKPNEEGGGGPIVKVDGLDPSTSTTVSIDGSYSQADTITSIAIADVFNQVIESNEGNNTRTTSVTVQPRKTLVDVAFTRVQVYKAFADGTDGEGEWEMLFAVLEADGACHVTLDLDVTTYEIDEEGFRCARHRQNNVGNDSGETMDFNPGVSFKDVLLIESTPIILGAIALEVDPNSGPERPGIAFAVLSQEAVTNRRIEGRQGDECTNGRCYDVLVTVSNVREPPPIFTDAAADAPPEFVVLPDGLSRLIPADAELPDGILRMQYRYLPLILNP